MERLRFLPLALLTVLTVLAAAMGLRTPPPGWSPEMVAIAERHGYRVEPLEAETSRHVDDARRLAEQFGPTVAQPDRVLVGVGLARVLDLDDPRPEQRIDGVYWLVMVDNAFSPCFYKCSEPSWSPELTVEMSIVDPDTLESERMYLGD